MEEDAETAIWKVFYDRLKRKTSGLGFAAPETKNMSEDDDFDPMKSIFVDLQKHYDRKKDSDMKFSDHRCFIRIEQMDGEFFERFGSGLKETFEEDTIVAEHDKLATLSEKETSNVFKETALKTQLSYRELLSSLMELNINELYEEILHEIIHCIGVEKCNLNQNKIIAFAQNAFNIEQETHDAIYQSVKEKQAPQIRVNIEIIEGKNIEPKDANGYSDPFCILFLSSNPQLRYNTSVKTQTLRPVWEEYFSLPVDDPAKDVLSVEVWDFDPAETVKEKVTRVGEVKGFKGMKRFMKELAVTVTHGQHDNEIIGTTHIPLKTIPSRGQKTWYNLENKGKPRGNLLVNLSFGSEKNKEVSAQEHRHLLRVLLTHQINAQQIEAMAWMGDFLPESGLIIQQHAAQSNISPVDECLGQWIEFIGAHAQSPVVNPKVFSGILDNLAKPISTGQLSAEELRLFWQSTKKLLPFCFNMIRTVRKSPPGDEQLLNRIEYILNVLQHLESMDMPSDVDLFTTDIYGWLLPCDQTRDIKVTLHDAVVQGAVDWHVHILENNKPDDFTEEGEMKLTLKIIQLLKLDLQNAIDHHNKLFIKKMQFPYVSTLYTIYDTKIADMCEPFIKCVCMNMRPINYEENGQLQVDNDPLAAGTSLFELYMGIQKFAELGTACGDVDREKSHLANYHTWFQQGVARWLDIAAYKAMQRIERAVELDKLIKVDSTLEYSSSAVDTLAIFYQIKVFWHQLAWPDAEGSYSFVAKIIDDICKCSLYYSDKMGYKVSHAGDRDGRFDVTKEWCLAVNNIDYIKRSIRPFVDDLGLTQLMDSLARYKSDIDAERCKKTLELVVDNAVDTVNNKIIDLLQIVADKMSPEISKFLIEGGEVIHTNSKHLDDLMQYLDENLCTLSTELNEENFQLILDIILEQISDLMFHLIYTNVDKKKPTSYFRNLRDSFHVLFGFLRNGNETEHTSEKKKQLESLLKLHAADTADLVHDYYLERLQEQNDVQEASEGVLTVKLMFIDNVLKVDVLNANRIRSMDSNGYSDPFVKIRLIPEHKFLNVFKPKTAVQKKTLSPLFDECFRITLTPEQLAEENGIVMFKIEDQDFMGMTNEFIAEAFVHFKDIPSAQSESEAESSPQIRLNLTVPKSLDSKILSAIDNRSTDKVAKDFIKRIKTKIAASNRTPQK